MRHFSGEFKKIKLHNSVLKHPAVVCCIYASTMRTNNKKDLKTATLN
jgi:hypothetical protein